MKRRILFTTWVSVLALAQVPTERSGRPDLPAPPDRSDNVRLPNGKLQRDEILKADQQRNLADAAELARLAAEVKEDIEKNDRYVVSVKTLKKLDDIAKLTRNIHGRLNRY
jgi:hypothetical protein